MRRPPASTPARLPAFPSPSNFLRRDLQINSRFLRKITLGGSVPPLEKLSMSKSLAVLPPSYTPRLVTPFNSIDLHPDHFNRALARCCHAWKVTLQAAKRQGLPPVTCQLRANEAYRNAMPPLSTSENIRDFVACTAYGMISGTILYECGTKLLYAAQVAGNAQRRVYNDKHPRSEKRSNAKKTRARSGSRKHRTTKK